MGRDMRSLLKIARAQGYEVRMAGKHRKVYHDGVPVLVMSLTPRARSATDKVEADLRRVGVQFPWRTPKGTKDGLQRTQQEEKSMVTIETQNGSRTDHTEVRPAPTLAPQQEGAGTLDWHVVADAQVADLLGTGDAPAPESDRAATVPQVRQATPPPDLEDPTKVCARCRAEDQVGGDPRQGRRPRRDFGPNRATKDGLSYYCRRHNNAKWTPPAPQGPAAPRHDDLTEMMEMMATLERRMEALEARVTSVSARALTGDRASPPPVAATVTGLPADLAARLLRDVPALRAFTERATRLDALVDEGRLLRAEAVLLEEHGAAALARHLCADAPDEPGGEETP